MGNKCKSEIELMLNGGIKTLIRDWENNKASLSRDLENAVFHLSCSKYTYKLREELLFLSQLNTYRNLK